ncbi:predicted protein [Nematostella vectensis]|uniref:Amino acid transporter transmembrane domain-containing protein n=1 Tax=Nematostella vectensis TaxID=45351 RepID=A7SMQ8_NEMVE|nr:vesicular inhibitory amino acid transporter [Nematostella vectensis]EDO35031.1 predicted protein [Nematostella vectensis]|eukprot:XP_001627131.1 predicted protein [Nematostella vectensis]
MDEGDQVPLLVKAKSIEEIHKEENETHSFQAFFNIFNANMGTGILAMPYVIRLTGYWGVAIVILVALLGNYTGKILIHCLHENTPEGHFNKFTYADLGEAFWPKYGRLMVHITNFFEQFSHCTLFLIMCGTVMHHTFPDSGISESLWICIVSFAVVPCAFVRTMKHISHISILTVIVSMGSSTCVLGYSLYHHDDWKTHNLTSFNFRHMSIAMGIVTVTFSSTAYLPAIERSMKYPAEFNAMMNFTYTLVTIIKYNYGILVYFAFGKHTEQLMTLSLPLGPFRTALDFLVIITALLFYVVPMFTLYDIFENQLDIPLLRKVGDQPLKCYNGCTPKLVFRFVFVVLSMVVAIFVPHFGLLMAFVGGFTGSILVYIFPCMFHVKLHHKTLPWYYIALDVAIIVFGAVACLCGVVFSGIQIAKEYDFYKMWGIEPDTD